VGLRASLFVMGFAARKFPLSGVWGWMMEVFGFLKKAGELLSIETRSIVDKLGHAPGRAGPQR